MSPKLTEDQTETDVNILRYEELKSDKEWFRENEGKYIAIIDGKEVGITSEKREEFLSWLRTTFPQKTRLVRKIGEEEEVMPLP